MLRNLRLALSRSWRIANYLRVIRVFANFGWSLTDATVYRIRKPRFRYELERGRFLEQLGGARGAIVLTAHMGNYGKQDIQLMRIRSRIVQKSSDAVLANKLL